MKQKFVMMVCWICMIVMVASCNDKQDKTNLLSNPDNPVVKMETSYGDIFIELFEDTAPVTVENFIEYVNADFYNGTIFHRVINEFMIQGGGYTPGLQPKKVREPIKNEADNGVSNKRGTIAMARSKNINSATSQFFINVVDNSAMLDFKSPDPNLYGYAVFGDVIDGLDVIDAIKQAPTTTILPFKDVPKKDVMIKKVVVIKK